MCGVQVGGWGKGIERRGLLPTTFIPNPTPPTPPHQPLEPILLASLRIHFADFPDLHSSTWLEAIDLGDLLRL